MIILIILFSSFQAFAQQTSTPLVISRDWEAEAANTAGPEEKSAPHREGKYFVFSVAPRDKLLLEFSLPKGKCQSGRYYLEVEEFAPILRDKAFPVKFVQGISVDECGEYDSKQVIPHQYLTVGPFAETTETRVFTSNDVSLEATRDCAPVAGARMDKNCNIVSKTLDPKAPLPPNPFIDKEPSLGECQALGMWKVRKETILYDKIKGTKIVATLKKDSAIEAVAAESITTPIPVDIIYDHKNFKKGDRIYILTSLGEGYGRIWHNGKVIIDEIYDGVFNSSAGIQICEPSPTCWGKAERHLYDIWDKTWVKFKLPNGDEGWSKEARNFEMVQSC